MEVTAVLESLWLVFGTVCPLMSSRHKLCLFQVMAEDFTLQPLPWFLCLMPAWQCHFCILILNYLKVF